MPVLVVFAIIYCTFMLTLNFKVFRSIGNINPKISTKLQKYHLEIWFGLIVMISVGNFNFLYLTLPQQGLTGSETVLILVMLIPFMLRSGYTPKKDLKGITKFCVVYPIGEELLFRGIVLALATYLYGNSGIEVPIPILKAVSLPVFISAVCFGITHFQYFGFKATEATIKKVLFAFVFGLFVGNIVAMSGSILYGIAFHIIANSGATLFYLKNSKAKPIEISRR